MLNQEQIVALLDSNTEQAEVLLVSGFQPLIVNACMTALGRLDDDAVQEAAIALLKVIRKFRSIKKLRREAFTAYATKTVRYSMIRFSMKNKLDFMLNFEDVVVIDSGFNDHIEHMSAKDTVVRIMSKLDPRDRRIIKEYYLSEKKNVTMRSLGKKYGVSGNRIMQLIKRALGVMRRNIKCLFIFTCIQLTVSLMGIVR